MRSAERERSWALKSRMAPFRKPGRIASPALALLLLCSSGTAFGGRGPVIESIEGDKIVVVVTPEGNRVGKPGTEIRFGDRIKTGPKATAKIRYPDGSKLIIGRSTEMAVLEGAGEDAGRPTGELLDGRVRGLIRKKIQKRPSFVIKTKSAVLGVRGTDFFFSADSIASLSEIHVLDGAVEAAKTESALLSGKGVTVTQGQTVKATAEGLGKVVSFDRNAFVASNEAVNPGFSKLAAGEEELLQQYEAPATPESSPASPDEPVQPESVRGSKPPEQAPPPPGRKPSPDPGDSAKTQESASAPEPEEKKATDEAEKSGPRRLRLFSFQLNQILLRQPEGGQFFSSQLSWNPTLYLVGPLSLRGHLGVYYFQSRTADVNNAVFGLEGAGLLSLRLGNLIGEVGAGQSTWLQGHSRPGPLLMANAGLKLSEDGWLERLFVGVARFDRPTQGQDENRPTYSFKLGVGIQF